MILLSQSSIWNALFRIRWCSSIKRWFLECIQWSGMKFTVLYGLNYLLDIWRQWPIFTLSLNPMRGNWWSSWIYICVKSKPQPACPWGHDDGASVQWLWLSACLIGSQQWWQPLGNSAPVRQFQFYWVKNDLRTSKWGPWTFVVH